MHVGFIFEPQKLPLQFNLLMVLEKVLTVPSLKKQTCFCGDNQNYKCLPCGGAKVKVSGTIRVKRYRIAKYFMIYFARIHPIGEILSK